MRVGGAYELAIHNSEGNIHTVAGVYREITKPERLVFTWRWITNPDGTEMLVTLTFTTVGNDTVLDLHQTLMPSDEAARLHNEGWSSSFNKLEVHLSG
ncbi:MAG: SRPBCC domain-containing protein [Rhodospirillales bacterium]|nr:SRPBCC domain-containing protein [Rhodospirillales bacterium]